MTAAKAIGISRPEIIPDIAVDPLRELIAHSDHAMARRLRHAGWSPYKVVRAVEVELSDSG